jgi:hypothetical protein
MKNERIFGLLIASALASSSLAFAEGTDSAAPAKDAKAEAPYCQNTCKGNSDCSAHGNTLGAHKNTCAGQGFVKKGHKSAKACAKAGGKWSAS